MPQYDNRLKSSLDALESLGYETFLISLESAPPSKLLKPLKTARTFFALLLGTISQDYSRFYYSRDYVKEARSKLQYWVNEGHLFDKVVIHDWEPLPLVFNFEPKKIYLDCHEFSFDEPHPFGLNWLMGRYKSWLILNHVDKAMQMATVSPSIRARYEKYVQNQISVITNRHEVLQLSAHHRTEPKLKLAYSGKDGSRRNIIRMFWLSIFLRGKIEFHLYLAEESSLNRYVYRLLSYVSEGFLIKRPLPREILVKEMNLLDYGVFFARPNTVNTRLALPNKLFEYLAASLPTISSEGLLVSDIAEKYSYGITVGSNFFSQLATLRQITRTQAERQRTAAEGSRAKVYEVLEGESTSYSEWLS